MSTSVLHSLDSVRGWHVLASSCDLALRHVFQARVGAYNLALWRSDDGLVNAWENRCPHRSVPLSMGINLGQELRCQYHGWRFASGSGECTTVPAEVGRRDNHAACVNSFDCIEQDGWVWVALAKPAAFAVPAWAAQGSRVALRALPVHVAGRTLVAALEAELGGPLAAHGTAGGGQFYTRALPGGSLRVQVQTQSDSSCILHAQWGSAQPLDAAATLAVQRQFNTRFSQLRARLEAQAQAPLSLALPEPMAIPLNQGERQARQSLKVAEKVQTAHDVVAFRLVSDSTAPLQGFTAGAHLEVVTPGGLVRHYSLVNGPAERSYYVIGVKREAASRGGSRAMCDTLQVGDTLSAGRPVNRFGLQDAAHSVLIAGGIGITPLLAMAQQLQAAERSFVLHYFVRGPEHVAFAERIAALGGAVQLHTGLDVQGTADTLQRLLATDSTGKRLYVCGPGAMMDLVLQTARTLGWPEDQLHREYFANTQALDRADDSAFDVVLQRSGKTLHVPAGRTIVQVVREAGVSVNTVCEQGACGTCETAVLEGEPDHRDVYLSADERLSQRCTMVCVSRAKTPTLVLDL
jgi:ferredoxin-NADP reductase/nitrite reductase/ring-hydroxylating ferredoxin subunit